MSGSNGGRRRNKFKQKKYKLRAIVAQEIGNFQEEIMPVLSNLETRMP